MAAELRSVLKHEAINGWRLFWLISLPMSLIMVIKMIGVDMTGPSGVSEMIAFSVRWAVPFIYLVTAASAAAVLFPGPLSMWLLRNRKFLGFCFAVAMAWQGVFIFIMSWFFRGYYFDEIYYLRDELEGSTGYIFLTAMVLTSFEFGRRRLSPAQWKLLHRSGVYFLWAYPFSVYWWNLSYYPNPQAVDYLFYWSGFAAFAMRIVAWARRRTQKAEEKGLHRLAPMAQRVVGTVLVAFGLVAASTGRLWQESVTAFLTRPEWSANLEMWLPFWPFEPFLSLFLVGLGAWSLTASHVAVRRADQLQAG